MSKGILYYNRGTGCLVRMLVSIQSLRTHYSGPISIAHEGKVPEWFEAICVSFDVSRIPIPESRENVLMAKSKVWRVTPFEHTMFLDADTIVRAPVEPFLDWIVKYGAVVTKFNDWHTHRGRMRRRIEQWNKVVPELIPKALAYGFAINTGIQGWTKGNPILPAYEAMTARGNVRGIGKKMLDEIAMQILLPDFKHHLAGQEWNCGCVHSDGSKAKIIHYHGHKHCRDGANGEIWKEEYRKLVSRFPQHRELSEATHDPSIDLWLAKTAGLRSDLTIVTAVNPAYADRARANIERWMQTPGLREQKFIVFVNGFKNARDRKFLERKNFTVIRWEYPHESTPRETMLASFVLGAARHVKTPYWLKLDADTAPKQDRFEWPKYDDQTIVSHRWGYTKMKGDANPSEHWFNRLDKIFANGSPMFKTQLDVKSDFQVSHRPGNKFGIPMRFGSFCHIEKTAFTKRMADVIKEKCAGRLPIPSQDTLSWYCATLWKEPVKLMNMKEWFQP